jgi:hypothetical protein
MWATTSINISRKTQHYEVCELVVSLVQNWTFCTYITRLLRVLKDLFIFFLIRTGYTIKFLHLFVNFYSRIFLTLLFWGCGRELFFVQHKLFHSSSLLATTICCFSPWTPQAGTTHLYLHFQFLTLSNVFVCFPFSMVSGVVLLIHRWFEFTLTRSLR